MSNETARRSLSPGAPAAPSGRVRAASRPVERIDAADLPYEDFLRRYLETNRPVVVRNAVTQWPALAKWTPEHFKQRFGQRPVAVSYDRSMPFDRFIDEVVASSPERPGPYMFRLFLHEHLPELLPDVVPQNPYSFPRRYASPLMPERWRRPDGYLKLLIGGVGSRFPVMHFDGENAHACITEIYGDKEFVLYPPEDAPYLYVDPARPNASRVDDPTMQDLARFPLLAKATQYRTVLEPGDMVFVPSRWWHTARPLSPSVSVCMNLLDGSNWPGFVREVFASASAQSRPKALLKKGYLEALGALLSAFEGLQRRAPRLAATLGMPVRMAPVSAAVAPDPSMHPLDIRIPTE